MIKIINKRKKYYKSIKKCLNCGNDFWYRLKITIFCYRCRKIWKRQQDRIRTAKFRKTKGYKKFRREKERKVRQTIKGHLNNVFGSIIRKSLKNEKSGYHWEKIVGYTYENLKEHLEKQFDDKMSWDNYGSYWWIDHIKPRSLFYYEKPEDEEFKKCWALDNLQPLEKFENMRKSNHFPG